MRSSAEVLEGNKVKLSVEVDEEELQSAVKDTFKRLQREVRVPGFRPGKVPQRVLEVRLGGKAIREEVIRTALPDYYAQAVEEASLDTIAAPEIDITAGEEEGPLAFDAVVEVRPKVSIAGYEGLQVTLQSIEPSEEDITAQLDRMRDQFAELKDVERAVADGDVVTVDVQAVRGEEVADDLSTDDFVYSVGSEMIAPGVDEAIVAKSVGDTFEVVAEDAPGGAATLKITVKLIREKVLPEANDAWASDASEFDTLEELRADVIQKMTNFRRLQARVDLRDKAVEALAALVSEEIPQTLINESTERHLSNFVSQLASRGISVEQYLDATGKTAAGLLAELKVQGETQVRADLALRALAEAQDLQVSDEELGAEIARLAEQSGVAVRDAARQIAEASGLERLRLEVRNAKAAAWLVDHVEAVDENGSVMDRALLLEHEEQTDSDVESAAGDESSSETSQAEGTDGEANAEESPEETSTEEEQG